MRLYFVASNYTPMLFSILIYVLGSQPVLTGLNQPPGDFMDEVAINSYLLNLKKWNAATYSKYFLA